MIAPKPTLPNAAPSPGTQTVPSTLRSAGRPRCSGATGLKGRTDSRVASGASVVASAIAAKP